MASMSIVLVRATIECDGCGRHFHTDLDEAYKRPEGWTLFEEAEDMVRGGHCYEGGICSVMHGLHLCPKCTGVVDENTPVPNTKEQCEEALRLYGEVLS